MVKMEKTQVPKLLRVHEVAKATGIQTWRVYQMLAANEGPPYLKIGKTLWIPEDTLAEWIKAQAANSKS